MRGGVHMFDETSITSTLDVDPLPQPEVRLFYLAMKRLFDVLMSLALLPVLLVSAVVLLALNPFVNPGPLLYKQPRMGHHCCAFMALKFRSMQPVEQITRGADDPVETDRIRPFGGVLRKTRLDELPQILNVLRGDMSLIGPRPDYFHHARRFVRQVPGYRERHSVRPGISGLAQVEVGYVQGVDATRSKVRADLFYIENAGFQMDAWVFWRTLCVVIGHKGL